MDKHIVSIKGIIFDHNKIILLKNERDEWELPGGKLEPFEEPETCLAREIKEELGLDTEIKQLIDVHQYHLSKDVAVLIITYLCKTVDFRTLALSTEHTDMKRFDLTDLQDLKMPKDYKNSIHKALNILSTNN